MELKVAVLKSLNLSASFASITTNFTETVGWPEHTQFFATRTMSLSAMKCFRQSSISTAERESPCEELFTLSTCPTSTSLGRSRNIQYPKPAPITCGWKTISCTWVTTMVGLASSTFQENFVVTSTGRDVRLEDCGWAILRACTRICHSPGAHNLTKT